MKRRAVIASILLLIVAVVYVQYSVSRVKNGVGRANVEIRFLSSVLEAYKTDHGHYPSDPQTTDRLNPDAPFDAATQQAASAFLYRALTDAEHQHKESYMPDYSSPNTRTDTNGPTYLIDPWGNCLGYSTFKAAHPKLAGGYNPTFDLWSTGRDASKADPKQWIKNW